MPSILMPIIVSQNEAFGKIEAGNYYFPNHSISVFRALANSAALYTVFTVSRVFLAREREREREREIDREIESDIYKYSIPRKR